MAESFSECNCKELIGPPKLIVITGGPGAGKTALLEIARKDFCKHISILPEAASILFQGGFLRHDTKPGKKALQRAIFRVQRELEQIMIDAKSASVVLCDRGTLDGLAYWPDTEEDFWHNVASTKKIEMNRYAAVIHLQTPRLDQGYNHQNPVRIESAEAAAVIDKRIASVWKDHIRYLPVESDHDFLLKVATAMKLIRNELP